MNEEVSNQSNAQAQTVQQPQPAFCKYCGKPIKPQDAFCPHCGKPLTMKAKQEWIKQNEESTSQASQAKIVYRRTNYAIVEIMATVILLVLCIVPLTTYDAFGGEIKLHQALPELAMMSGGTNLTFISFVFFICIGLNIIWKGYHLANPISGSRSKIISLILLILAAANGYAVQALVSKFDDEYGTWKTLPISNLVWVAVLLLLIGLFIDSKPADSAEKPKEAEDNSVW